MRLKGLLAAMVALAVTGLLMPAATAHTPMLRASPDRDATVGGSIRYIDLEFLDPVTEASVTVTYNGVSVPGQTTVVEGVVITFTLDQPLTETGRYQVNFEMISPDGDFTTGGHFFTFDPAADPVARIEPEGSGGSSNNTALALSGAALAVFAMLLGLFLWRINNRRRKQFAEAINDYDSRDAW